MIVFYKAEQAEDLYVECSDTRLQGVDVYVNDQQVVSSVYPESAGMIHIGNVNAGDEVKWRFATAAVRNGASGIKTVALYARNEETVQAFKEYVLKNTMEFDGYDGNCLNGHITADKAGSVLAVPYNEGFTAAVDGR